MPLAAPMLQPDGEGGGKPVRNKTGQVPKLAYINVNTFSAVNGGLQSPLQNAEAQLAVVPQGPGRKRKRKCDEDEDEDEGTALSKFVP
jgi:hypothetical protein